MSDRGEAGRITPAVAWPVSGAGLGLVWGIAARLWMRFISTDPEFTWSGTIYIVLAPTIIGLLLGLALAAARNRWRPRLAAAARGVAGVSVIILGVGAGALVVPTVVFGGLAVFRSRYPWWLRITLGLLLAGIVGLTGLRGPAGDPVWQWLALAAGAALVVLLIIGKGVRVVLGLAALPFLLAVAASLYEDLPVWRATTGLIIYLALLAALLLSYGLAVRPPPVARTPSTLRPKEVGQPASP
jgi:hypothetical protein